MPNTTEISSPQPGILNNKWLVFPILGVIAAVYVWHQSPYASFHDSLGFLYEAMHGFRLTTNATNHFLYINFQHVLLTLFSFADPVRVMTGVSFVSSLIALYILYRLCLQVTQHPFAAVAVLPVLAFSYTWWRQSEIIEVYTFHAIILLFYMLLGMKDVLKGKSEHWVWISLLIGLGCLTHIQHVLSGPFFLYYLLTGTLSWKQRGLAVAIAGGIFSLLLIPPLLLDAHPVISIFFESQFRDNVTGFDLYDLFKGTIKSLGFLAYNFHIFLLPMVIGAVQLWKHQRTAFWFLASFILPYYGFGMKYNVNDAYVFFLSSYLPLSVCIAVGIDHLIQKKKALLYLALPFVLLASPMLYSGVLWTTQQLPTAKIMEQKKEYKGGMKHLFWPGKRYANDPLEMARSLDPADTNTVEWNLVMALKVLEEMDKVDTDP